MSFDDGRKKDIEELQRVLRTSNNPKEIAMAKSSLAKIDRERWDTNVVARRKWMLHELKQGRVENVRGIQSEMRENVDKRGTIY
jgi:hypothetical protein